MENNGYHLDLFTNSMIQYFNEVLIHKNYVLTSFRKYYLKDGEDAEFSFQIKPPIHNTDCDEQLLSRGLDSTVFTEEDFKTLISSSQLWSLHLADVSIKGSRLFFKLDHLQALRSVIKSILNEQTKYGIKSLISQEIKIYVNESSVDDLTNLRLRLLKKTAENLLNAAQVHDSGNFLEVCLTTKILNNFKLNAICGVVINSNTGTKETRITPEDYYNIQLRYMRTTSEHKYWENENEQLMHNLADANVKMCLLEVNPKRTVSVKIPSGLEEWKGSTSKGAVFVLYNCARLASIRKKFEENCDKGIYPDPPSFEELDFNLLQEKEEWFILLDYLLEYPTMIRKIMEDLSKGVINFHQICRFLSNLSSIFSVYYRRVRILLEPKQHLLPVIFVRIQFLKAIEQVMHNALSLLDIQIIEEM